MRGRQPTDRAPGRRSHWWRQRSSSTWWALIALTAVGLGMLGATVHMEGQVLALKEDGVRTTVTVVQVVPGKRSTSYRVHFSPGPAVPPPPPDLWAPNVRGSVGQVIEVAYLPGDPNNVTPTADLGFTGLLLPGLTGLVAVPFLVFAVVVARSRD